MNTVYRFRIYPNRAQRELFAKTFGCVRFVYNRMLAEKKAHYEKTGKSLNATPAKYKAEFPWLKEVDSLALCNAQMHLQTAYKNFFRDPLVGFPKFKSKKKPVRSYTTNYVNGNIALQDGKLKLPKAGWVRIRQHRKIDASYQLKSATISQEADERYYVALLYSCEEPVNEIRKAESAGKTLVRVDRWYPSSKTCSCCGAVKEKLKLDERIYECACGNRMDRDENAAINICREGLRVSGMVLDIQKKIS